MYCLTLQCVRSHRKICARSHLTISGKFYLTICVRVHFTICVRPHLTICVRSHLTICVRSHFTICVKTYLEIQKWYRGIDMPGQQKEDDCSRTISAGQSLNPNFPFPNRIDLSRTAKWCHLWSTESLWYFVLTPLCAHRSSHVCWYLPKDLLIFAQSISLASAAICPKICWYLTT